MARRGFLDYVLGGAVGGLEGLAQKRAAEEERKRMADAAAMDRARLLMQLNYRVAPDADDTIDPAARSILPSLEMPSAAPPSATRAGGALSAALNRGFGVDATKPSLSRGLNVDPLAMDRSGSNMMEMFERAKQTRAAQEAIAASVDLGGGQKVRFLAPESAAQIASRTRTESDAKRSQELSQALSALTPEQLAQYGPLVRASIAGVPSGVLQSIMTKPAPPALRYTEGETGISVYNPDTGTSTFQPYAKGYTPKKPVGRSSTAGAGGMKPPTATDATKEAQGIKFLSDNRSQEVMLALQKAIEVTPALAGRPGLVGYGLMQQAERKARADAAGKPKAGGRTLSKPPGMGSTATDSTAAKGDIFDTEWEKYNKGGK